MLHIAGNIKLIRSLAGKTQPEFAIIIGENLSNLKTYETKGVMPKPHIQHRIAKIGGVSLHDLINKPLTPDDIEINLQVDKVKKVNKNAPVGSLEAQQPKIAASDKISVELSEAIKELHLWRAEVDAAIAVIKSEVVPLLAKANGKSVASVDGQMSKDIDEAIARRMEQIKKKR